MTSELEAAIALLLLSDPLQNVSKGTIIEVMYVMGNDARKRKWFTGIVKQTKKVCQGFKKVCIAFDDGIVNDFCLHSGLYQRRKEAGWRIKAFKAFKS